MHLPCLFKAVILQEKIAVIASFRVGSGLFDDRSVSDDKGKTGHRHQTFLSGSHAEIDVILLDIDRAHRVCTCGIHGKYGIILMYESTDLTDRIKNTRTGLVMRRVNKRDIRVILQRFLNISKVRTLIDRELQLDIRNAVTLTDLDGAGRICTVIDDQDLLSFRKKGVDANVDVDRSRPAEKH